MLPRPSEDIPERSRNERFGHAGGRGPSRARGSEPRAALIGHYFETR
jgi:hypothetical protein